MSTQDSVELLPYGFRFVCENCGAEPRTSNDPDEKETFVQITLIGGSTYTQPLSDLGPLMEELAEYESGTRWLLELVEMTRAEYDLLPEFKGH